MTVNVWGTDEIAYLAKNYSKFGAVGCGKKLKSRTISAIQCKARDLGLRKIIENREAYEHTPDPDVYDLIRMSLDGRALRSQERMAALNVKIIQSKMRKCEDQLIQARARETIRNLLR